MAEDPDAVAPRLERAGLLAELGRVREARDAYLDVLARAPSDRLALNNLGTLLHGTGYKTAARTAYAEAAARHPGDAMSHVNLANVLYENGELEPAREHYETALRCAPDHPEAHQGLAYVLAELGDAARAAWHRRKGFEHRAVQTLPYRGDGPPVPLLLLVSAVGGNIPTRNFLDDRVFETTVVVPEFYDLTEPLPPHSLIFNAIGDADLAGEALAAAQSVAALSGAPVLNAPAAVMATGRADNAQRLARLPGVIAPATVTLARELLSAPDAATALARHGLSFPLLVRTPGFHTGRHFVRVESAGALAGAVARAAGRRVDRHRVSGFPRRRWQGPQIPRDDDRRLPVSVARGDFEPLEDPLLHRRNGRAAPSIAPRMRSFSRTCRPCWGRAPWRRSNEFKPRSVWTMRASISA